MTDDPRYFRCQNVKCARKWHRESLEYEWAKNTAPAATDLFSKPKEPNTDGCPACGGALKPEAGTFEEYTTTQAA